MTPFTLDLLGGFRANLGPRTLAFSKKAQALLAYLALSPGRRHSRARLADLLWGDRPEDLARNSVRHALSEIRKPFGSGWARYLAIDHEWVELLAAEVTVDALELQRLAAEGTLAALEQAARLCRGDLLEGCSLNEVTLETWLIGERERVHELGVRVLAALLDAQIEAETADSAIQTGIRLLAFDPLRESAHRTLMRLYTAQGRPAAARRQYQLCADALMRELRVEPEAETRQLYREVVAPRAPAGAASGTEAIPLRRRAVDQVEPPADSIPDLPLIGRAAELARLRQALRAAQSGQAHVVSILGEAGVGKTRLVQELAAAASEAAACLIEAGAHESEQILPFSLWVEALRRSGLVADPEALGELAAAWRQELARLFPQLRSRGTPPRSGMDDHLRIFEAIAQLVDITARRRPVLILLEDLHWADPTSLRLVPYLARRLAGARVCVVLTTRTEETDSPSVLRGILAELARETRHVELRISPLGRAETIDLLRALSSGVAPVAVLEERIWRLSGGNPFVVVEAMRTLQEGGRAPGDVPIPDGVRRMIAERLERLGPLARELAALAAVMDGPFEAAVLQDTAAGREPHDVALAVEELVRQHILQETAGSLAFTHDRIRETIYGGLVEPRRRLLHVAAAEAIERLRALDLDPHRAALAGHWRAAQVWDRAALHLRAIATQAVARGAYREALALLEEALRALERLPADVAVKTQAIDVHVEVRDLLVTLGEISASLGHTDAAGRLAREVGDQPRLAIALAKAGHSRFLMDDQARAIELGEEIHAIGKRLGDERIEAQADFRLGQSYHALGDYRRAVEHLERSSAGGTPLSAMIGLPSIISRTWLAVSLAELGRFDQAIGHAERALADAEAVPHLYSRLFALLMLGRVHLFRGDPGRAVPPLEQSYALAEAWHVGLMRRDCAVALAEGYARAGRSAEARALLERRFTHDDGFGSRGLAHRSEAMLALGQADEALPVARDALERARRLGERAQEARALRALGEALAQSVPEGRDHAAARYRQSLSLAEELGMRPLVARCYLGIGLLDAARDSPAHLERAATLFGELGMPCWLAQARAALARGSRGKGRGSRE